MEMPMPDEMPPFEPRAMRVEVALEMPEDERIEWYKKHMPDNVRDGKCRVPKVNADMIKARMKEREQAVESVPILTERNVILEEHARQTEAELADTQQDLARTQQQFGAYKKETDAKIEKLASLVASLIKSA